MTLSAFIDFVRNRHNATSDSNWSDSEIRALITARANEALSFIGLIEATTTAVSVASTAAYNFPSYTVAIENISYDGQPLDKITYKQYLAYQNLTTPITGRPSKFTVWNNQYYLYPTPDTSALVITLFYLKEHPDIDAVTQTTVDIPSVLHSYLANGVIADMYAKDLNNPMFSLYEQKWNNQSVPKFLEYKVNYENAGKFSVMTDVDSDDNYGWGGAV